MRELKLFIDGEYCDAAGGKTFDSFNPATGEKVATIALGGTDDVTRACAAAQRAFDGEWGAMDAGSRGAVLRKAAGLLMDRLEEFAELETLDVGKPITETKNIDISVTAAYLAWYGDVTLDNLGETIPLPVSTQIDFSLRQPYGVVAGIAPWNFPLFLAMLKIGPALAMGNTVVIKPARITSMTTLKVAEVFKDAGLPAGALNVVAGSGSDVGEAMCVDPRVKKVFFTGSTAVGRRITQLCAENITDISVELGGKSPNIVFADANWEQAVAGAVFGILLNNGQNCIAGSRLLVEKSIYADFTAAVAEKFKSLRIGNPMDASAQLGSIVSEEQFNTVMGYIEAGIAEGATVAAGGKVPDSKPHPDGWYIEPTLFTDVRNDMRIAQEEIFGPVLVAIPFEGEEEAVSIANDTIYGLGSGVFTKDAAKAHRMIRAIHSGTVYVNTYNQVFPVSPFPAWKQSGIGVERGLHGLLENCRYKNVIMDISDEPIGWFG